MLRLYTVTAFLVAFLFCAAVSATADVRSDRWVATDALGRTLPNYAECGPPRADRTVGIFYLLWLGLYGGGGPYDITKILAANPTDPQWGPPGCFHHWGESELGYYNSHDEFVIRKHCQLLVDAGIDVLIFDATNGDPYTAIYTKICRIFQEIRDAGGQTPQFCTFVNWDDNSLVTSLYNNFYAQNRYPDLWFRWQGKPLILTKPDGLSPEVQNFFTFRRTWAWSGGIDNWSWMDYYPQTYSYHTPGVPEEISVSIAQQSPPHSGAFSTGLGHGRSYHNGAQPPESEWDGSGGNFAEQWQRALEVDPPFVLVNEWNEWVAQRLFDSEGNTMFVDQYTQEYSRDIEPMKGGHTDNYYYQLVNYVRRYKGVREPERPTAATTILIDGDFSDWENVGPEYKDDPSDTMQRNSLGWEGLISYVNNTGRNDFLSLKVTRDSDYVYFYAQTKDGISPHTDPNWMLLFIDSDCDSSTGWNGYDYLINNPVIDGNHTSLKRTTGGWNWTLVRDDISYKISGNNMEIRVPRGDIGQDEGSNINLDFHWSDNIQAEDDIIEFSISGDSAPNRRFNYRYDTAPYPAANFTATPAPGEVLLNWTNPTDSDLVGVMIRYKTGGYPSSPTDGYLLYDNPALPGSSGSYAHTGFDNIKYYYTAFSYDHAPLHTAAYALASPLCGAGINEIFNGYSDGALGGQGSWTTTASKSAEVQSLVAEGGTGKSALMEPEVGAAVGSQIAFTPRVQGYYYIDLDVRHDSTGGISSAIAGTVNIYPSESSTEMLRIRIQKDRIVFDPATYTYFPIQPGSWHNIRVGINVDARTFDIWFDGSKDIEDYPWKGTGSGISRIVMSSSRNTIFQVQKTYIDNLSMQPSPAAISEVRDEGDYTPSLSTLEFSFDSVSCAGDYRYCIGTTSGGSETRGWTGCGAGEVEASGLSLVEGQQYFITAQAGSGGLWGEAATSDGITAAVGAAIPEAKTLGDGEVRALRGKTVSAVFSDCFYVQEPDKPFGIKVVSPASVNPGDFISLAGALCGAGYERFIDCSGNPCFVASPGPGVPGPIAMSNKNLGGGPLHPLAPGVLDGLGPNNIGLLVRCWGRVSNIEGTTYHISDGSGVAIKVQAPDVLAVPVDGTYVVVTGISALDADGGRLVRVPPTE